MRPFQKADSAQKCAELVMSDAKCGDAFSYSTAEKYCDCPPDGSHCTLADLSSGGYGVYEFQTCGEACFVDVMCTRPSTPGYAIETETLNAPSFAVKFKNKRVRRRIRGLAECGAVLVCRAVQAERVHGVQVHAPDDAGVPRTRIRDVGRPGLQGDLHQQRVCRRVRGHAEGGGVLVRRAIHRERVHGVQVHAPDDAGVPRTRTETLDAPGFKVTYTNNECAAGYAGTPKAKVSPVYEVSGCTPFKCTRPSTPGYPAPASETLDAPGFKVTYTNNECAAGYAGTPEAKVCASAGPYTVSGCTPFKCTRPTTPGYPAPASETLDAPGFKVTYTNNECAAGYAGTPKAVVCASAGPYTVSGCTPFKCTRPTTPGYPAPASETLDAPGFKVTYTNNECAAGYAGTPEAKVCASAGPYTVSGCTPFKCTRPTTPGYPAPASETLDAPGFKVTYTNNECAAGYTGTPKAVVCASAGPYEVSGCSPMKCGDPPAGKGYKSGKDKTASCGGKCEDMCFEPLKCGSVAFRLARSSPTASRPRPRAAPPV